MNSLHLGERPKKHIHFLLLCAQHDMRFWKGREKSLQIVRNVAILFNRRPQRRIWVANREVEINDDKCCG